MKAKKKKDKKKVQVWFKTGVENLLRHKGGTYYARFRIGSKRKLISLRTDDFTVAKLRLRDEAVKIERLRSRIRGHEVGDPTMGDLATVYAERFESLEITEASKRDRRISLKRLVNSWPGFKKLRPSQISSKDIWTWANRLKNEGSGFVPKHSKNPPRKGTSGSAVNRSITAIQQLLDIAVEVGAVHVNAARQRPPAGFGRLRKKAGPKAVHLPPAEVMMKLLDEIERPDQRADRRIIHAQKWHRLNAGELCRFCAYSGARVSEAGRATWADDRDSSLILHGTKTQSSDRTLPMNPSLRRLLDTIRRRRKKNAVLLGTPPPRPSAPILAVRKAQKSITRACKVLGIERLTHHDFRHEFATRCLELGIDPKIVAEWLGHSDGGVLVLKVYGHVRPAHSAASASKLVF